MKVVNDDYYIEKEDIEYLKNKYQCNFNNIKSHVFYSFNYNFIKIEDESIKKQIDQYLEIPNYDEIKNLTLKELSMLIDNNDNPYFLESILKYLTNKGEYDDDIKFILKNKYRRIYSRHHIPNNKQNISDEKQIFTTYHNNNSHTNNYLSKKIKTFFKFR